MCVKQPVLVAARRSLASNFPLLLLIDESRTRFMSEPLPKLSYSPAWYPASAFMPVQHGLLFGLTSWLLRSCCCSLQYGFVKSHFPGSFSVLVLFDWESWLRATSLPADVGFVLVVMFRYIKVYWWIRGLICLNRRWLRPLSFEHVHACRS